MIPPEPCKLNWTAIGVIVVAVINISGWFIVNSLTKQREATRGLENKVLKFREFLFDWRNEISKVENDGRMGCLGIPPFETRRLKLRSDAKGIKDVFANKNAFDGLIEKISRLDPKTWDRQQKAPKQTVIEIIDGLIKFTEI
jgi:heme/copper-type cytochrome/quinol oxidase subunit 2